MKFLIIFSFLSINFVFSQFPDICGADREIAYMNDKKLLSLKHPTKIIFKDSISKKFGLKDTLRNVLLAPEYDIIDDFGDLYIAKKDSLWSILDSNLYILQSPIEETSDSCNYYLSIQNDSVILCSSANSIILILEYIPFDLDILRKYILTTNCKDAELWDRVLEMYMDYPGILSLEEIKSRNNEILNACTSIPYFECFLSNYILSNEEFIRFKLQKEYELQEYAKELRRQGRIIFE